MSTMRKLVPPILLTIIILSLITPIPATIAGNNKPLLKPAQTTKDLNLTRGGGWYYPFPFNPTYFDEWGMVVTYRYPVSQMMGGYFTWDSHISDPYGIGDNTWYASDGLFAIYSYAFESFTSYSLIFFDNYSIAPKPYDFTFDVVTDVATGPYNETYDAVYWVAVGYDYGAELTTGGIPVFFSGLYGALTDGDFLRGDVGQGYFDFDLPTARALFGGDNNVTGIALTTLTVANGLVYTGGFYVYNNTVNQSIDMPPIIIVFNATTLQPVAAMNYPSDMWVNSTFLPSRMIYYNGSIYMIGYREEYYSGYGKLLDYILIYKINASNLADYSVYGIPAYTGGYVGRLPKFIPYMNEYPVSFLQKLDAVIDNTTGILYIAGVGFDQAGDPSAYIVAYNLSSNKLVWRNLIGADHSTDFAGGIDLVVDYKGNKYIVVNGALNYTVSENLTGYNVFYALLDADTGHLDYLYVVGGKGADLGFDLGQIVYYSPDGPVIRPFYTALVTNSTGFWLRDVTDLYNSGTLNTTSLHSPSTFKAAPITPSTPRSLSTHIKSAAGHPPVIKKVEKSRNIAITSHQAGYMTGGLLQPALPPATTLIVTHQPERFAFWTDTTKYILINITATLIDNWTGNPISGEELWLYVSGPGIENHLNATNTTNSNGVATFQYNATKPGTYSFEILYPGTAYHYRAFEIFQIFLSPYRTIAEIHTNATSIYTLFEKPAKLYGHVYIRNGTKLVPFNHTTVIIDVYFTPLISYLFFGDYSHTGWLWDQGAYFTDLVTRTDDNGYFEVVLTNTTYIGYYAMYYYRSDIPENTPSYLFRAVVPANETIVTPENTSDPVQVFVEPTPTRIEIVNAPSNGTTLRAGDQFNVTIRWVWSHDNFTTTHPMTDEPVVMYYDAKDAGVTTGYIQYTDTNGYAVFPVSADTLGTLFLNFTNYYFYYTFADALTILQYNVAPAGINVSVTLPPSTIYSIDNYKVVVRVIDNETGAPKADVAVWIYINGTAHELVTDTNGEAVYTHNFLTDSWLNPGPLNITVVVNGTANVGGTLVKTYNVTVGGRTEAAINVVKTPTYIYIDHPSLVNATQDYTITPHLVAYNSTGHGFEFTGVTLGVSSDYGFTGTATTGASTTIPGTPDAGNYTVTLSYTGSKYLAANTTSFKVEAKWLTRITIISVNAEGVNSSYAKVIMTVKVERYYFNESAWKPMPGVQVKFYYVGSIGVFATNTTGPDGTATGTGLVPRHNIQAFGASASAPNIQPSSRQVSIQSLPGDVILAVLPAPEPPILPVLLLAAILLFIVVKKRK